MMPAENILLVVLDLLTSLQVITMPVLAVEVVMVVVMILVLTST